MNNDVCTGLRIVPLTADYPKLERLFEIRDEAFPANERLASRDISSYTEYTEENGYVSLVFEEDNALIGFVQLRRCGDDAYYGIYLAIGKEYRNKQYGSRALKLLIEEYLKGKMMFGCVEALLPEAENYEQRVARARFYQRNGMFLLDGVLDGGPRGKYQFVCTDPNATFEQLKAKMSIAMPMLTV